LVLLPLFRIPSFAKLSFFLQYCIVAQLLAEQGFFFDRGDELGS